MRYLKHFHYDPFNLCKRFVYLAEVQKPSPKDIAQEASKNEKEKIAIPDVVLNTLNQKEVADLKIRFDEDGKKTAEAVAKKGLEQNPNISVDELKITVQAAYRSEAQKVVDSALSDAYLQLFAEGYVAVASAPALAYATMYTGAALGEAGMMASGEIAATGMGLTTNPHAVLGAIIAAEVVIGGVGVKMIYDENKNASLKDFIPGKQTNDAVTNVVAQYNVKNLTEGKNGGKSDLKTAIDAKGGEANPDAASRGAALLGRQTASDIISAAKMYGSGTEIKEVKDARIAAMKQYSEGVITQIGGQLNKPGADRSSPVYKEAYESVQAINAAVMLANQVVTPDSRLNSGTVLSLAEGALKNAKLTAGQIDSQKGLDPKKRA